MAAVGGSTSTGGAPSVGTSVGGAGGTTSTSSTGTIVSIQTIPMSITTCTTAKGCANVKPFCASSVATCYNKSCNFVVDTTAGWTCECYLGQVQWCSTVEPLSVKTCVQLDAATAVWSDCRPVAAITPK